MFCSVERADDGKKLFFLPPKKIKAFFENIQAECALFLGTSIEKTLTQIEKAIELGVEQNNLIFYECHLPDFQTE